MDPSTYRSLAFLFSLGALPVACTPEENGTASDSGGTGGTTGGSDSISGTDGPTTTATATEGATGTDGGTGTGGTSEPTTGGGGSVCEAFADHLVMCEPTTVKEEAIMDCEAQLKMTAGISGEACVALFEAYYACETAATCDSQDACEMEFYAALMCKPEPGAVCQAYGAKYFECYGMMGMYDASYFAGACQQYVNYGAYLSGPACGSAIEEYQACLSKLSCAELMMPDPCPGESMKIEQECDGGGGAPAPGRPGRLRR